MLVSAALKLDILHSRLDNYKIGVPYIHTPTVCIYYDMIQYNSAELDKNSPSLSKFFLVESSPVESSLQTQRPTEFSTYPPPMIYSLTTLSVCTEYSTE